MNVLRHSAHIPGGSNHVGIAADIQNVGIDGALGQKIDAAQFARLLFKDFDKFLADNPTFFTGVGDIFQGVLEPLPGVDPDKMHVHP